MLKQNLQTQTLILPFSLRPNVAAGAFFPTPTSNSISTTNSKNLQVLRQQRQRRYSTSTTSVKDVIVSNENATTVKAVVTALPTDGCFLTNLWPRTLDYITDLLGKSLLVELVAAELDPKTRQEKTTVKAYARKRGSNENEVYYESELQVPEHFGEIGAIFVENGHRMEMYLKNIVLDKSPVFEGTVEFTCNSWVQSKFDNLDKRIFFTNKSYLPSQTPNGLTKHREKELQLLRGNGEGERKAADRIYDYDFYNDLGNPDNDDNLARPVLGGSDHPYPRRCRTGRARSEKDPETESRSGNIYVPRDEAFSQVKQSSFTEKTVYSVLPALLPSIGTSIIDSNLGFATFRTIDSLFDEGILLPDIPTTGFLGNIIPRLLRAVSNVASDVLQFETPEMIDRDKFSWIKDAEFARQTLAGTNPCCIKLVTKWPIKSALDPAVYGPAESAITEKVVEKEIGGICSLEEALKTKKLFVLDYHDLLMPYVSKVRELEGTTLYGSRTLFFLTETGTLRPIAIELTRPPMNEKPQWKQVFVNCWDATGIWLWRLAKAHVLAHDSCIHELVSHWLRTHCCMEPYIIAANRQLSAMHPIYRLMHPHFRYTMNINALARSALINSGGIIEFSFSLLKYSTELSSVVYDLQWQFDLEALPADLINRGMAVEDPNEPHGLKLTIEDYPFANDGLLIWDAIKEWVADYVNYYYPNKGMVESDSELQAFWTEVKTVGHGDKKDAKWWPNLKTNDDLIGILTTMIWVASGHHAAVNFGQFDYGGYFPNRPTIARNKMPTEDLKEEEKPMFLQRPEEFLLESFPSQIQATIVMAVLDILSTHSPDEEYIGEKIQPYYASDKIINAAFERFNGRLKEIEGIIDARNADLKLQNRSGAGVVPYQLLKPFSEAGVTGKGIPSSTSI